MCRTTTTEVCTGSGVFWNIRLLRNKRLQQYPGLRPAMSRNSESPHDRFEELLVLSFGGELSGEEEDALEAHLAGCDECQAALASYSRISSSSLRYSAICSRLSLSSFSLPPIGSTTDRARSARPYASTRSFARRHGHQRTSSTSGSARSSRRCRERSPLDPSRRSRSRPAGTPFPLRPAACGSLQPASMPRGPVRCRSCLLAKW
ncbi:MAG: anti-sigma factor family protein [Bryobacteraceae bacterium]